MYIPADRLEETKAFENLNCSLASLCEVASSLGVLQRHKLQRRLTHRVLFRWCEDVGKSNGPDGQTRGTVACPDFLLKYSLDLPRETGVGRLSAAASCLSRKWMIRPTANALKERPRRTTFAVGDLRSHFADIPEMSLERRLTSAHVIQHGIPGTSTCFTTSRVRTV